MTARDLILVAAGGAIGAMGRYYISYLATTSLGIRFPFGTLIVNVLGCFLLGLLAQLSMSTNIVSHSARMAFGPGLLGALTTFSTFGLDTVQCWQQHTTFDAMVNVLANVCLGLLAVTLGMAVAGGIAHVCGLTR